MANTLPVIKNVTNMLYISDGDVDELLRLYNEPHRYYHNADHIENMLALALAEHPEPTRETNLMILAILYHDAVYYPQSKHNEELSAAYYDYTIDYDSHNVSKGILATKNHWDPEHVDQPDWVKDLLDYDLHGFTGSQFKENTARIWLEYASVLPIGEFIDGRKKFFNNILNKKHIFWLHPEWEEPARKNIEESLREMEASYYREYLESDARRVLKKIAGKPM